MLADVVIDTNILVHAANPGVAEFEDALDFVTRMAACDAKACIDADFSLEESRNKSLIVSEYLKHVRFGTPGWALLTTLALGQRVIVTGRCRENRVRRRITQLIRKPVDRVFLSVAAASTERVLASHDYEDMPEAKRATLRDECAVHVLSAAEAAARLAA